MKEILYRIRLGLLSILMVIVSMLVFVSCSDDDDSGVAKLSGPMPVYLHVSADMLGDLNATRADDPYAEDGEFMNTLCVFVVNSSGTIEAKFGPDILQAYSDAATGNLTDWTSDEIMLNGGEKTIYAFSNWDNTESDEWTTLIAKEVGESISAEDLNFTVDDPASKVDIENGKYIPMSGKTTVSIGDDLNYSSRLISVGMDRLVGKVTIAVNGAAEADVTLGDLNFTGWADKVPMMSDDDTEYTDIAYENGYEATLNQTISANATSVQIASFYVNETYKPSSASGYDGFDITLDTDQYEGMLFSATTARTEIPRNYIYPILLTLDTYELVLTPTVWTSILGVDQEIEYTSPIYFVEDTYYITLLEVTSTFSITPSLFRNGTEEVSPVSWDWTYLNISDESTYETSTDGIIIVTSLTATPGYEYGFTLFGEWTANSGATLHSRTYNVKVIFEEGWPTLKQSSRAWRTRSLGSEIVRMKVR